MTRYRSVFRPSPRWRSRSVPAVVLPEAPRVTRASVAAVHAAQGPPHLGGRVVAPIRPGGRHLRARQGLRQSAGAGGGVDGVDVPAALGDSRFSAPACAAAGPARPIAGDPVTSTAGLAWFRRLAMVAVMSDATTPAPPFLSAQCPTEHARPCRSELRSRAARLRSRPGLHLDTHLPTRPPHVRYRSGRSRSAGGPGSARTACDGGACPPGSAPG
jgi:hypothetical protein